MEERVISSLAQLIVNVPAMFLVLCVFWMLVNKTVADINEKLKNNSDRIDKLDRMHTECKEACALHFKETNADIVRLNIDILNGINELKISMAKIEGAQTLAKDIAKALQTDAG